MGTHDDPKARQIQREARRLSKEQDIKYTAALRQVREAHGLDPHTGKEKTDD